MVQWLSRPTCNDGVPGSNQGSGRYILSISTVAKKHEIYIYMQKEEICFRWISAVVELSASDRNIVVQHLGLPQLKIQNKYCKLLYIKSQQMAVYRTEYTHVECKHTLW